MSLYGIIFSLSFFLILSFFFSPHTVDYAKETDLAHELAFSQKAAVIPIEEKKNSIVEEKSTELTTFYENIAATINKTATSFDGKIGITYIDLTTGEKIAVNGEQRFFSASTIKVPLAMMIADKVANGELKWEDQLIYKEKDDYEEGTGIIVNNIQPTYSLRTLQEYNIVYSDNIAKNMLYDTFGGDKAGKKAITQHFFQRDTDPENTELSSNEAAEVLSQLYQEKATNSEYQTIYDYMKQTVFHERMDTATTSGKVAHKIGSYDNFIHDIGILETDHPFILAIYTDGKNGSSVISELTDQLWELQQNEYPKISTKS
ncbi:serine hydrolase [Enterococcus sp. LJL99]